MRRKAKIGLALLMACHFVRATGSAADNDSTDSVRSRLVADLKRSEQLISRVRITAEIRSVVLPKEVLRETDETAEQFIQRCISAVPEVSEFVVPVQIERDFNRCVSNQRLNS